MIRERREELGISQAELARRIGIAQPSLHNIEIGKTKHSRHLHEIYSELGLNLRTGSKSNTMPGSTRTGTGGQADEAPVYSMQPSADGESVMLTERPTRYVTKPRLLDAVPDVFGICVWGDEGEPKYEPGEIIFIHPDEFPTLGAHAIVRSRYEGNMEVFIGRLMEDNAKQFTVQSFSGEKTRTFQRQDWRIDWICGKYSKR